MTVIGATELQYGALTLSPRTLVLSICSSYRDGGQHLRGSRLSAAYIRLQCVQQLQGWVAAHFKHWDLA
eukprot:7929694-Pyramimonas_sp.AAC.1